MRLLPKHSSPSQASFPAGRRPAPRRPGLPFWKQYARKGRIGSPARSCPVRSTLNQTTPRAFAGEPAVALGRTPTTPPGSPSCIPSGGIDDTLYNTQGWSAHSRRCDEL